MDKLSGNQNNDDMVVQNLNVYYGHFASLILVEIASSWLVDLFHCRQLKKHQFGGDITLSTPYFSTSLASSLWYLVGNFHYPEKILLKGTSIEQFNILFGEGNFGVSGWCFDRNYANETWIVESIAMSHSLGDKTLKIVFTCNRKNWQGQSFRVS